MSTTVPTTPTAEQEKATTACLKKSHIKGDETLPRHVLEGIARGQKDIEEGRFITHEELVKRLLSTK